MSPPLAAVSSGRYIPAASERLFPGVADARSPDNCRRIITSPSYPQRPQECLFMNPTHTYHQNKASPPPPPRPSSSTQKVDTPFKRKEVFAQLVL